jgi:hypothetical protein
VKALTIHQPWASLIAAGVKTIETRDRRTNYRGSILIHAGRRLYTAADKHHDRHLWDLTYDALDGLERSYGIYDLPYGAVVATAQLVDCVPMWPYGHTSDPGTGDVLLFGLGADNRPYQAEVFHRSTRAHRDVTAQLPFGVFAAGRWAWLLDDVRPFLTPVSARGKQTVPWTPTEDEQARITEQLMAVTDG